MVVFSELITPDSRPPRLEVELVPETCWLSNVRSYMSERRWRKLAGERASRAGGRCVVCGGRGRRHAVECHECWLYDDNEHIQTLICLDALCPMCHRVKHLGRSIATGYRELACGWLARVNGWDAATTEWYVARVYEQWRERSQHEWTLDLTTLGVGYDVSLGDLALESYLLNPAQRKQMVHRREATVRDVYSKQRRAS